MIKTGIGDLPYLVGLEDAIKEKQTVAEFLADLDEVHKAYAQSVYQSQSVNINVPLDSVNSNTQSQKSEREIDLHDAQDITDMRTGYDPVEAKASRSPCTGSGIFGLSRINFT